MDRHTAQFLIDQIAILDAAARQLAGAFGELNRDRVVGPDALSSIAAVQTRIEELRRIARDAGANKLLLAIAA